MAQEKYYKLVLSVNGKPHTLGEWIDAESREDDMLVAARWVAKQLIYEVAVGKVENSALKTDEPYCQDHHQPMILKLGKYGRFYSCPVKLADGTYCRYRP
jgi:hypothetical protein